jgi:tRNA G18 (ribose-2'-O)-methylase SpoU
MFRDDSVADKPPVWKKMRGNDHFFHALSYSFIACEIDAAENYKNVDVDERECLFIGGEQKGVYKSNLLEYIPNGGNTHKIRRW